MTYRLVDIISDQHGFSSMCSGQFGVFQTTCFMKRSAWSRCDATFLGCWPVRDPVSADRMCVARMGRSARRLRMMNQYLSAQCNATWRYSVNEQTMGR
eukprot:scaffold673086_cov59-Prasinocladus_malaysianus.AAC.2